jgi:hypothetical protein
LVYTTYTGKRDTASRLKRLFENENLKTAIMRSTVGTKLSESSPLSGISPDVD